MADNMLLIIAAFSAVTTIIFQVIFSAQSSPFIDEIFHIPQAIKYCNLQFNEWDSKITTLPGMYITSFLALLPFSLFKGSVCTVWTLRYLNVIMNTANLFVIYLTIKEIQSQAAKLKREKANEVDSNSSLCSLAIGLFPLLYFYSFLYYTDPGSTLLVLVAYLACLKGKHKVAAVLSLVSIIFRQSNIIWTVFMAGVIVANHIDNLAAMEKISTSPEVKDKIARFLSKILVCVLRYLLVVENLITIALLVWPYIAVIALFGIFVFVNDGIVVGDRQSHQAVLHFPQLLYFSAFVLFFSSPILLTADKVRRFVSMIKARPMEVLVSCIVMCYVLAFYSHVHPYLLADNRHYTFYIWRWFLGRAVLRYLLVPVYTYSLWSMNDSLENYSFLWKAVLFVSITVALVPQKLLEFRYFLLPYIFFRMHVVQVSRKTLVLEVLLHVAVNAFTVAVFLSKTFAWKDLPEPQRIMW